MFLTIAFVFSVWYDKNMKKIFSLDERKSVNCRNVFSDTFWQEAGVRCG